jgi:hypothetical protein
MRVGGIWYDWKGKEIDDLEVETKLGEALKKRSLDIRVRKRKARPDSVVAVKRKRNLQGKASRYRGSFLNLGHESQDKGRLKV